MGQLENKEFAPEGDQILIVDGGKSNSGRVASPEYVKTVVSISITVRIYIAKFLVSLVVYLKFYCIFMRH